VRWTWDPNKAAANRVKHGLSFETARLSFDDPLSAASSARGRPRPTKGKPMKKETSKRLTGEQLAELKSLAAVPDSAIDTSDAPELLDWSGAKRGVFYRPVKQQLTLRLDADVVAWFKSHTRPSEGYQTRINRALREYMQERTSRSRRSQA
jgi:uncharacterized protein (DUF4415 family)